MKVAELLKKEGIRAVLNRFNSDLKAIRTFLKVECGLDKGKDLSPMMREFKANIKELTQERSEYPRYRMLLQEILEKTGGKL
jgi:hypothetical protein